MINTPTYAPCAVPQHLQHMFSRILHLKHSSDEKITIPARPTGRMYLGWMATGRGEAQAAGRQFIIESGQAHLSGQLSVLDASYSIQGNINHFLAEFSPLGAFSCLGKNLSSYTNHCEVFSTELPGDVSLDTFTGLLAQYSEKSYPISDNVRKAVDKIEANHGDVSIGEISKLLNTSERNFRREFLKHIGLAPKPYALIRKVVTSLQMLAENPDIELQDVIHQTGFYDQAHLTKVFQLYLHTTPSKLGLDEDGTLHSIVANS